MVKDEVVRSYTDTPEFKNHSAKSTDYLGNLKDGTWVRFSSTGINLVGENHTLVRLEETVPAVHTTSFIYEPFSSDDLSSSPAMNAAYQKENAQRFKTFGVDGVADKKRFGAESLYPKIGYTMVLALPYFKGTSPLDDLKPAGYVGQPIQRYLKIAWGMSADAETQVAAQRAASKPVKPRYGALADCHTAVKGQLDAFITARPLDGFLGDALTKPGKAALLPSLARYAAAVSDAMIEMAADDPSSRLDPAKRTDLNLADDVGWVYPPRAARWAKPARELVPIATQILAVDRPGSLGAAGAATRLGRPGTEYRGVVTVDDDGRQFDSAIDCVIAQPFLLYDQVRDPGSAEHYYTREVLDLAPGAVTAADFEPPG